MSRAFAGPAPAPTASPSPPRAAARPVVVARTCAACEDEEPVAMRTEAPGASPSDGAAPVVPGGAGGGAPLPVDTRSFFESRFGHDFRRVRVHADTAAASSARALRAQAYTLGDHVVFAAGRYAPHTPDGQRLLAHELAHVVQQEGVAAPPARMPAGEVAVSAPGDALEREADRAADAVMGAGPAPAITRGSAPRAIHRRWDAATTECGAQTDRWLERVVVEQETPQSVTLQWSDRSVESATTSTGKGHCCVDPSAPDGTSCTVAESRRNGSNCTPITDGAGELVQHRDLNHRGIEFWTEFVPARAIALHTFAPVDGTPLSHGCVRLDRSVAQRIFCGARQRQTRVEVRGFPRPRCNHPALQDEWMGDFFTAGSSLPDGDPVTRAGILEERRALNEAFGRTVRPSDFSRFTAADIPRCTSRGALPTTEEARLTAPVEAAGTPAQRLLVHSGFRARGSAFIGSLERARSVRDARAAVERQGRELWQAATARAQTTGFGSDDRPLYWSRLEMTRALRQWQPAFAITSAQRQDLETVLETASRGMTTAAFDARSADKRILISGFDPFSLGGGGASRGNPSGAAVIALDGKRISSGGVSALIQGVIFPVRFRDFDAGIVERFFRPHLSGAAPVSLIMTISQGGSGEHEVEEWAGRRRGEDAPDNLDVTGGGTDTAPIAPPGVGAGAEFLPTALPAAAIRQTSLGRTGPMTPEETGVREIPAGARDPVDRASGPTPGSTSVRGAGGGYLSNEIFYRTSLLRIGEGSHIPVGHLHTPWMGPPQGGIFTGALAFQRERIVRTVERILTDLLPRL